jgi:cyclase
MPAFDEEFDDLAELGTRAVTHLVDGAAQLTPRIEVLPASGHTAGDLLVLVADTDVCFAGDLCFFGVTPLAFQGDPAQWADVLDAVVELADVIVPGHGPIGGEAEVRDLQGYLRACVSANGDVRAIAPGPWDSWIDRDRDAINVERAALLAHGDDVLPPSMLKAIGQA